MPIEIIKSSDDFSPHIAVCHMDLQGGSANEENIPLVMKAKNVSDGILENLKSLGEDTEDVIKKASYHNIKRMLQSALMDALKNDTEDYWVYIEDFDSDTVVFEYKSKYYAVSYSLNDRGMVLLGADIRPVVEQEVYISEDGSELVLKTKWGITKDPTVNTEESKGDGQSSDISHKVKERKMSDKIEMSAEEIEAQITKAAAAAVAEAKAQWDAEQRANEVTKSTTEIVKGFSFIDEADSAEVVKSLVGMGEDMLVVLKALTAAKDAITAIEEEKEQIKKEFGQQQSVDAVPSVDPKDAMAVLKANIAATKAATK